MPERSIYQSDRPSPRYVKKYDKPSAVQQFQAPQTGQPQRRRRADNNKQKKEPAFNRVAQKSSGSKPGRGSGLIRTIAFVLIAMLLLGFAFSLNRYSQAKNRLDSLRAERQAEEEKHLNDVASYVNMRRRSGYDEFIRQYAREFSVNRSFISAIIARESSYVATAQSSAGARGLMQIMPDTGDWAAGRLAVQPYNHDRLFEPELNIRMGAWYLNYLSSQFAGDPVMIASAFHAGANNVKQWAMKYGTDQKTITMDQIPTDDTKDYVKKVMKAYALFYEYDIEH